MTAAGHGDDVVGPVLEALADATRRSIFERVAEHGPVTATILAGDVPVSRQAVSKHLERLADAGLVVSERIGRETRWSATPAPLDAATDWFATVGARWDRRLAALAERAAGRSRGDATPPGSGGRMGTS